MPLAPDVSAYDHDPAARDKAASAAVLVATCSRYDYILDAFLTLLRRYWPQCELPIYLSSDSDPAPHARKHGVVPLHRSEDRGFLESWLEGLGAVREELVLVMQEDFLLERPVDDALMASLVRIMLADPSIVCVRTMPWPAPLGPLRDFHGVELGVIRPADAWSFSWQAALWRRDALRGFLAHRIGAGNARVAEELRTHPEMAPEDLTHRAPRPAPDAYAWFNPEWYGFELAELFPDTVLLGVPARTRGDPEAMLSSPLPYWPTAIVEGELKHRAQLLLRREGIPIQAPRMETATAAALRRLRHRAWSALRSTRRALSAAPRLRQDSSRHP